jgi:hypothetical protein
MSHIHHQECIDPRSWAKLIGEAVLLASVNWTLSGNEMASRFNILSWSKDPGVLQRAADALTGYCVLATIWMIGSALILYSQWGRRGFVVGLVANLVAILWTVWTYKRTFRAAAQLHNQPEPTLWSSAY